MFKYKINNKKQ